MAKSKDVITPIKKATCRKFSADDKIRIVLEGLRGEVSISEICSREGIASSVYYKWSKAFLEAGKNGLLLLRPPFEFRPTQQVYVFKARIGPAIFGIVIRAYDHVVSLVGCRDVSRLQYS